MSSSSSDSFKIEEKTRNPYILWKNEEEEAQEPKINIIDLWYRAAAPYTKDCDEEYEEEMKSKSSESSKRDPEDHMMQVSEGEVIS